MNKTAIAKTPKVQSKSITDIILIEKNAPQPLSLLLSLMISLTRLYPH